MRADWVLYYIDYRGLKKLIKARSPTRSRVPSTLTSRVARPQEIHKQPHTPGDTPMAGSRLLERLLSDRCGSSLPRVSWSRTPIHPRVACMHA